MWSVRLLCQVACSNWGRRQWRQKGLEGQSEKAAVLTGAPAVASSPPRAVVPLPRYVEDITDEAHVERELMLLKVCQGGSCIAVWPACSNRQRLASCICCAKEFWLHSPTRPALGSSCNAGHQQTRTLPFSSCLHSSAWLQVQAPPGPTRTEVTQIADIFRAHAVDVSDRTLTLQVTGDVGKVCAPRNRVSGSAGREGRERRRGLGRPGLRRPTSRRPAPGQGAAAAPPSQHSPFHTHTSACARTHKPLHNRWRRSRR